MDENKISASDVVEEFAATKGNWAKMVVPNKQEAESVGDYASYLEDEVALLKEAQPMCWELKETYDDEFSKYKRVVEEVRCSNRRALETLNVLCHSRSRLAEIRKDIEALGKLSAEECDDTEKKYFEEVFRFLKLQEARFDSLGKMNLEDHATLTRRLESNASVLEELISVTHSWMPLEKRTITIKPEYNPPEGSSMEPRKAETREFVSKSICVYCSKQIHGSWQAQHTSRISPRGLCADNDNEKDQIR